MILSNCKNSPECPAYVGNGKDDCLCKSGNFCWQAICCESGGNKCPNTEKCESSNFKYKGYNVPDVKFTGDNKGFIKKVEHEIKDLTTLDDFMAYGIILVNDIVQNFRDFFKKK